MTTWNGHNMDVIRFADILKPLPLGKDLKVLYTITKTNTGLSSRDWVGLYKEGWSHTRQYLAFEWAPSETTDGFEVSRRRRNKRRRSVLFPCADIQVPENNFYQLVYVNRRDEVLGISKSFVIGDNPPIAIDPPLPLLPASLSDQALNDTPSDYQVVMEVDTKPSDHSQKSTGEFELVNGSRDGSEEELVFVDHVDVVSSMEQVHQQENIVEEIEDAINWGSFVSATMENKDMALVHVRNEDRALVKVDHNSKALVPYRPRQEVLLYSATAAPAANQPQKQEEKKKNPFDMVPISTTYFTTQTKTQECTPTLSPATSTPIAVVSPLSSPQSTTPLLTPLVSPLVTPVVSSCPVVKAKERRVNVKQPTKCRRCRQLQSRLRKAVADVETAEMMQMQEQTEKENKMKQLDNMSSRIKSLLKENARLQNHQNSLIEEHNNRMETEQQASRKEKEMMNNYKDQLQSELEELKKQNMELNEQLDNILYSLSVHGVSGIKESNGKILDLSVVSVDPARPLPADGWKVARSRKEERLVGALRDRERQLAQASQQCECLQQQIQASQSAMEKSNTQLQSEQATVELLQRQLVEMDGQVYDLKQHVIVLKDMLDKEEKRNRVTAEEMDRKESALQAQISHLSQLLKEARQPQPPLMQNMDPWMSKNSPLPDTNMDVTEKPTRLSSMCMDDPAIIAATWSSAPTTPSSFPVPFAGFFCNNPPSTDTPTPTAAEKPKPKPQKLKKLKKLAPAPHPVYYPVYEPMKFHPGFAVKESELKRAECRIESECSLPKKRKLTQSPPIEVKDNCCSRCGMKFPKDCAPERIERHRQLHRKVGG